MQVAIISDTHVPDREDALPQEFRERIGEADHVVHAGDVTSAEMLATVRDLAADLTAVHGNVEDDDVDLPTVETVDLGGVTFVVFHNYLGVRSRADWLQALADAAMTHAEPPFVGVGGHSHEVVDEEFQPYEDADVDVPPVRLLNPGSATGADPAEKATMLTAEVADGEVDVTLHEA
jgi:putative phosphoesterase